MARPTVVPTSEQGVAFLQVGELLATSAAFQTLTGTANAAAAWAFIKFRQHELRGDAGYNPANGRKEARIFESERHPTETQIGEMAHGAFDIILNLTVPDAYLDATQGHRHLKYTETENAAIYWENLVDAIRTQIQLNKTLTVTVGAGTMRANVRESMRPPNSTGCTDSEKLQEGEKPYFQGVIVVTW